MFELTTFDPAIMGGRACIRGMRITVAHVVNLVANGMTVDEILADHPNPASRGCPPGAVLEAHSSQLG